jgi:site-specific recombinase XerD
MKWDYWIGLYVNTHCMARGLRALTIRAYEATLKGFRQYAQQRWPERGPDQLKACDILEYLEYLRRARDNGASALNRQATVLRNFYRAVVAMGHLAPGENPMAHFPKIKAAPRKLPLTLSREEVSQLLEHPPTDTVLGIRDRAVLTVLYGTGIRASECAGLREQDIQWEERTIRVTGKGGHERTVPLNEEVVHVLRQYQLARGGAKASEPYFRSREGGALSRNAIYERVRRHAQQARIPHRVSPHQLRHTFATHLVQEGVNLVTLRDLLGHRQITSTQIYIHLTAQDLRKATDKHPVGKLIKRMEELLPNLKLPFQGGGMERRFG